MASRAINAKDIILFKGDNPDNPTKYLPVGCLTNLTVGRSRSTTDVETKCGTLRSEGSTTFSAGADTVIFWGNDPTVRIEHRQLVDDFTGEARAAWMIAPAIPTEGDNIIKFTGTISALNDTAGATGFASASVTFNPENDSWSETAAPLTVDLETIVVAPSNVAKNSTNNIVYITDFTTNGDQTPNEVRVTLTGTFAAGDITNVKFYKNTQPNLTGATLLGSVSAASGASGAVVPLSITGTWAKGEYYVLATVDVSNTAVTNHTIISSKISFGNLMGDVDDNQTPTGGTKTVFP